MASLASGGDQFSFNFRFNTLSLTSCCNNELADYPTSSFQGGEIEMVALLSVTIVCPVYNMKLMV